MRRTLQLKRYELFSFLNPFSDLALQLPARWIVEERADGANVNGWHWTEKDVKAIAEKRLKEVVAGTHQSGPLLTTSPCGLR